MNFVALNCSEYSFFSLKRSIVFLYTEYLYISFVLSRYGESIIWRPCKQRASERAASRNYTKCGKGNLSRAMRFNCGKIFRGKQKALCVFMSLDLPHSSLGLKTRNELER